MTYSSNRRTKHDAFVSVGGELSTRTAIDRKTDLVYSTKHTYGKRNSNSPYAYVHAKIPLEQKFGGLFESYFFYIENLVNKLKNSQTSP